MLQQGNEATPSIITAVATSLHIVLDNTKSDQLAGLGPSRQRNHNLLSRGRLDRPPHIRHAGRAAAHHARRAQPIGRRPPLLPEARYNARHGEYLWAPDITQPHERSLVVMHHA